MTQLVTRVDDELVAAVDALIAAGLVATRSDAVRMGLEQLIDLHRRGQTGKAIVDGYRLIPQSDDDLDAAEQATRRMILEEPW